MEPPAKKQKKVVLWEDDSSDEDGGGGSGGGVSLNLDKDGEFKINEEYARKFEYNKKREELARLEEKHGKYMPSQKKKPNGTGASSAAEDGNNDELEDGFSSSSSEDEDEEAALVTEALDSEITATLNAIRNKDPRVYDASVTFYSEINDEEDESFAAAQKEKEGEEKKKKEKESMTLRDYHRQNILRAVETGKIEQDDDGDGDDDDKEGITKPRIKTYNEEQEELKREVVREMHSAVNKTDDDDDDVDGGFLIPKKRAESDEPSRPTITEEDIANADKDPESFLSNFMAARAWLPTSSVAASSFKPLESDDEEELARAERFEEAFNLRFEDPNRINETLTTHDRELVNKYSVRREEVSSRKKKREAEKLRKEQEAREREAERARLRKLKLEQMEEKIEKIKKAAGLKSTDDVLEEDWVKLIDDDFGVEQFEEMMKKRFGEDYYAEKEEVEVLSDEEGDEGEEKEDGKKKKKKKQQKAKKPKWDDDIDIKDLVPDFEDEAEGGKISLSDLETGGQEGEEDDVDEEEEEEEEEEGKSTKRKSKQDRIREKKDAQREARKERRKIEALVDQSLSLEPSLLPGSFSKKKHNSRSGGGTFRYRETSPTSFGLSARDILLAEDRQLNQFAGLKKLAPFRDEEHKRKDKKKLGKKARLR
ncbi:KRRI-Interacting protein 1, partial [Ascosphaera aggregata]